MSKPTDTDVEDITEAELQAIHDQIDGEIEKSGYPSDDDLMREIEKLNALHRNS